MPPAESLSRLAQLVGGSVHGGADPRISDVTHDSRQAGPGTLFVAVRGFTVDGHDFADAAAAAGSPAIAVERLLPAPAVQLLVEDTRACLGQLAAEVHGRPSQRVPVIGVTGTNGKTSVTFMIEAIVRAAGDLPGLIGTVQTRVGDDRIPTLRTTPEAPDFQRLLATMVERGADVITCEVSSHALQLGRVDATHFAVAAFTNLSVDHLDFHGDMESYFAAKASLFTPDRTDHAVVWIDDPAGLRIVEQSMVPMTTVGTREDADVRVETLSIDLAGARFRLEGRSQSAPRLDGEYSVPLPGRFNVANAAIAAVCTAQIGYAPSAIRAGLKEASSIPGRFELISGEDPIRVVVDYAHTPAGIEEMIESARSLVPGRVICVFGAGGDRDRGKRPDMGRAAAAAEVVVVTSDNPRSEDPAAIIDQVMVGLRDHPGVERVADRAAAIDRAIRLAEDGDAVLVLGKGHERGQEAAGRVVPFDDRMVAMSALARRRADR